MNRTIKIILVSVAVLVMVAAAVTVKLIWFPSVKDAWFQANGQRLKQVPPGLVIVRPTHFPGPRTNLLAYASGNGNRQWVSGRNVTFKQLVAAAYDYDVGRVWLPPGTPGNNFDFLVTAVSDPKEPFRAAVRKKTGYIANVENRDTDVLALKVEDPNSQGIKVSDAGEKQGASPKNGRLYFTHTPLSEITDGMEHMVKMPVVDKTGLTNFYDFSLAWDKKTQQQIQSGNLDAETGKKILGEWGLALVPDTASVEMLVVKKAN